MNVIKSGLDESKAHETVLSADGLRYRSKASGSPFVHAFVGSVGTMSCIFCGTHRTPGMRVMQKVLGRSHPVCLPLCQKNPKWKKMAIDRDGAEPSCGP